MTAEELVLALKDIQPPAAPDWWLIAPAYLYAIFGIVAVATLTWLIIRQRRVNRLASLAEQDLQRISSSYTRDGDSREFALQLAKWLRQVAMLAYPSRRIEGCTGDAWLKFLDEGLGDERFSNGQGKLFAHSVYRSQVSVDAAQLVDLCAQWLAAVKPRLLQQGRD